jgi:hypothetical protein
VSGVLSPSQQPTANKAMNGARGRCLMYLLFVELVRRRLRQ